MAGEISEVEKGLEKCQKFVLNLRKFFHKNPEIAEKFEKFLNEKEDLIY